MIQKHWRIAVQELHPFRVAPSPDSEFPVVKRFPPAQQYIPDHTIRGGDGFFEDIPKHTFIFDQFTPVERIRSLSHFPLRIIPRHSPLTQRETVKMAVIDMAVSLLVIRLTHNPDPFLAGPPGSHALP